MTREDQNSLGHRLRRNKGAESISRKTSSCTQRTEEVDPSLDQVTPKQSCEKDECKLSGRTFCSQASSASQGIHGGSSRRSRLLQRSHRIATTARTYRKDRVNFHDSAPPIGPSTGQSHLEHQTHRLGRLQGAYLDSWIGLFGSLIVSTLVGFSIFFLATSTIGMSGTFGCEPFLPRIPDKKVRNTRLPCLDSGLFCLESGLFCPESRLFCREFRACCLEFRAVLSRIPSLLFRIPSCSVENSELAV